MGNGSRGDARGGEGGTEARGRAGEQSWTGAARTGDVLT